VIPALPAKRAEYPLDVGLLPGRRGRRKHLLDAHRLHLRNKVRPEDPIAIAQQIAQRGLPREGLAQLLSGPFRGPKNGDAKILAGTALPSTNLVASTSGLAHRAGPSPVAPSRARARTSSRIGWNVREICLRERACYAANGEAVTLRQATVQRSACPFHTT
jgi:hypothetical protein